jgi:hypothetical protein
VAFGPVVSGSSLSKAKVGGTKQLSDGTRADHIQHSGFQVHQHRTRHILASLRLLQQKTLVNIKNKKKQKKKKKNKKKTKKKKNLEIDIGALELQIVGSLIGTILGDSVLTNNGLPELGANLITALAGWKEIVSAFFFFFFFFFFSSFTLYADNFSHFVSDEFLRRNKS